MIADFMPVVSGGLPIGKALINILDCEKKRSFDVQMIEQWNHITQLTVVSIIIC